MKHILLALFLFITSNSIAQSYSTFVKNRPAYYQFNSIDIFYQQAAIDIDSFKLNKIDTFFYHSLIIDYDDNGNGCYIKANDTSFVGIASIRKSDGDDFFFNRDNDSIHFNNSASLNQNWEMYRFANGDVIKATVESTNEVSVLGVNDSVKTIKLQAQNSSGNNISNIFNDKIFKVGKATGFVSGYSLFHFPEDTIGFSIVGIENPPQGLNTTGLSPQEIFDFEVGDEFHYTGYQSGEPTTHKFFCTHEKILSKEVYGNIDSVRYVIDHFYNSKTYSWGDSSLFSVQSTIIKDYVMSACDYLNKRPFQSSTIDPYAFSGYAYLVESTYSAGASMWIYHNAQFNLSNDDCLSEVPASFYPDEKYAQGLGKASYYAYTPPNYSWDTLAYFKKDSVEWGTPVGCPIGSGINDPDFSQTGFYVFPNPSSDQVFLSGNFILSKTELHLLNLLGEEVRRISPVLTSQPVKIDISDLSCGIYLLNIVTAEKIYSVKVIKN